MAMLHLRKPEISNDPLASPAILADVLHGPSQGSAQRLPENRPTGLADGRQPLEGPLIRMALPQLFHQKTVRQQDEVQVPGLARIIPQLTISQAQLLLTIPMKGFRARPAMPVGADDLADLPLHAVGHQHDPRLRIVPLLPENHKPYFVSHVRDAQCTGEVPLRPLALPNRLTHRRGDTCGQLRRLDDLPAVEQLAIELQRTDIPPHLTVGGLFTVNMVEDRGIGEVNVEGEGAGDVPLTHPIDQLLA